MKKMPISAGQEGIAHVLQTLILGGERGIATKMCRLTDSQTSYTWANTIHGILAMI